MNDEPMSLEQVDRAYALHRFRASPDYETLKQWITDRVTQHFVAMTHASGDDVPRLQGACQELFLIVEQINDAAMTAKDLSKTLAAKAVESREAEPEIRKRQQEAFSRRSRYAGPERGGHGWDPRSYREDRT